MEMPCPMTCPKSQTQDVVWSTRITVTQPDSVQKEVRPSETISAPKLVLQAPYCKDVRTKEVLNQYNKVVASQAVQPINTQTLLAEFNESMKKKSYKDICCDIEQNPGLPPGLTLPQMIFFFEDRECETLDQSIEVLAALYERDSGNLITQLQRRTMTIMAMSIRETQNQIAHSYAKVALGAAKKVEAQRLHRSMMVWYYRDIEEEDLQKEKKYSWDIGDVVFSPSQCSSDKQPYAIMPVSHPQARVMCMDTEIYDEEDKHSSTTTIALATEVAMDVSYPKQMSTVDEVTLSQNVQPKETVSLAPLADMGEFEDITDTDSDYLDIALHDTVELFPKVSIDQNENFLAEFNSTENRGRPALLPAAVSSVTDVQSPDPVLFQEGPASSR